MHLKTKRLGSREALLPGAPRFAPSDGWWLLVVVGLTAVVLGKDITKGGLRSMDCPVHAMDGVLVHDWIGSGPSAWIDPMGFAVEQYAHYPALSIGRHYPPGFAFVEAAFFGVFGISATSARLAVLAMGLLAGAGVYVFARRFIDRSVAALAAVILVTMPAVTLWGRQTMLELPTLSVAIWTAVALTHYLDRPGAARLGLMVAVVVAGMCFKQNSVFVIGAVTLAVAAAAWYGHAPVAHAVGCGLCSVILPCVVWLSMGSAIDMLASEYATFDNPWGLGALTYYVTTFPEQLGTWVLVAAVVGAALSIRRLGVYAFLLVAWLVGCYAMVTLAACKQPRFFFVGLFPFAVWAAFPVAAALRRLPARAAAPIVLTVMVWLAATARSRPIEYYPDHGPVVMAHRDRIKHRAVLFSGLRDGDFTFAVRQHIPWRQAAVIRANKLLYQCLAHPLFYFDEKVATLDDVEHVIMPMGLEHLFVERENRLNVDADGLFREYLARTDNYELIDSRRLREEPEPSYRNVTMDVYELAVPTQRTVEYVDIPVPRAKRTIRVRLDRWSG